MQMLTSAATYAATSGVTVFLFPGRLLMARNSKMRPKRVKHFALHVQTPTLKVDVLIDTRISKQKLRRSVFEMIHLPVEEIRVVGIYL